MATYTGTGQGKRGVGGLIWIAVVAFLLGAALVVALAAQGPRTSTSTTTTPVTRPIKVGATAPRNPEFTQAWLKLSGSGKTLNYRPGAPMGGTGKG